MYYPNSDELHRQYELQADLDGETWPVDDVLRVAAVLIAKDGWVTGEIASMYAGPTTYQRMLETFADSDRLDAAMSSPVVTQNPTLTEDIRRFINAYNRADMDLIKKARDGIAEWETVSYLGFALLAAAIGVYDQHQGLPDPETGATQVGRKLDAAAGHLGTPGETITVSGRIVAVEDASDPRFPRDKSRIIVRTGDDHIVFVETGAQWAEHATQGHSIEVNGTIKQLTHIDGVDVTTLSRPKPVQGSSLNDWLPVVKKPESVDAAAAGYEVGQDVTVRGYIPARVVKVNKKTLRVLRWTNTSDGPQEGTVHLSNVAPRQTEIPVPKKGDVTRSTVYDTYFTGTVIDVVPPFCRVKGTYEDTRRESTCWLNPAYLVSITSADGETIWEA